MSTTTAAPPAIDLAPPVPLAVKNVVAVAKATEAFNLPRIAATVPGADYDKKKFPGLILRLSSPKVAALVFNSGKIVLTGLPHPDAIPDALAAVLELLRTAGADIDRDPVPKVVNLVATGTYAEGVALHRLAVSRNLERLEYEPEMFPGLVYKTAAGPVSLVFGSGAFVVTGATSEDQARTAAIEVRGIIDAAGAWRSDP